MKQIMLSPDSVAMIEAIREDKNRVKSSLCDVFADVVFQAASSTNRNDSWRTLIAIQEYSHLIDCLSKTDEKIQQ